MSFLIVLFGLALNGPLPEPFPAAALPPAAVPESAPLTLTLAQEDLVCDPRAWIKPWADVSNPVAFATGPTARLDEQELWAASALAPLLALRYADGALRIVVVGVPVVLLSALEFTTRGWRRSWPMC